jgi:hypothetical protein
MQSKRFDRANLFLAAICCATFFATLSAEAGTKLMPEFKVDGAYQFNGAEYFVVGKIAYGWSPAGWVTPVPLNQSAYWSGPNAPLRNGDTRIDSMWEHAGWVYVISGITHYAYNPATGWVAPDRDLRLAWGVANGPFSPSDPDNRRRIEASVQKDGYLYLFRGKWQYTWNLTTQVFSPRADLTQYWYAPYAPFNYVYGETPIDATWLSVGTGGTKLNVLRNDRLFSYSYQTGSWNGVVDLVPEVEDTTSTPLAPSGHYLRQPGSPFGDSTYKAVNSDMKTVPVRFITARSSCTNNSCSPSYSEPTLEMILRKTNEVFTPVRLQHWSAKNESYVLPSFTSWVTDDNATVTWGSVKDQLKTVFPSMPLNAYADSEAKGNKQFWKNIVTCFADRNEITIWLATASTPNSTGDHPAAGHHIKISPGPSSMTGFHPVAGVFAKNLLAHELGHYWGLEHTKGSITGSKNPATGANWTKADEWDLRFCYNVQNNINGVVNFLFPTRANFVNASGACSSTPLLSASPAKKSIISGQVPYLIITTSIGASDYSAGFTYSDPTRTAPGLMRDFGTPSWPPSWTPEQGKYRYGTNVMEYDSWWGWPADVSEIRSSFISESQKAVVSTYRDVPEYLLTSSTNKSGADGFRGANGQIPVGCRPDFASSYRHTLGSQTVVTAW